MTKPAKDFLKETENKAFDHEHYKKLNHNIRKYKIAYEHGISMFADLENAKKQAHVLKWKAIENLDKMLLDFEEKFQSRGGKVIWANDTQEAQQSILKILEKAKIELVVKSKSMATEEIHLNAFLKAHHIEPIETDLGEYIIQLLGQKPYHIVTPAMHLSKEDIASLFHERLGTKPNASPETLVLKAREVLRAKYHQAGASITGVNFLLADTGSIALTENEGNARLSTSFPKVHIAVAGIEKIIPSMAHLHLFWPLLATHGTGQHLAVYNTILGGPRYFNENDGPEEMYVILLDNGRTNLLAQKEQRQGLYCIRCGACLSVCPIYNHIGGHAYEAAYSGPIGSLIMPHLQGFKNFKHLSYASSLCGKCSDVCPVKINIHKMLLLNRREAVKQHLNTNLEKIGWKIWEKGMLNRKWMDILGGKLKKTLVKILFKDTWGKFRSMPMIVKKSFSKQWKRRVI